VAVGGQLDQGVQAGQQPAVGGWHGGPFQEVGGRAAAACHAVPPAGRRLRASVDEWPDAPSATR